MSLLGSETGDRPFDTAQGPGQGNKEQGTKGRGTINNEQLTRNKENGNWELPADRLSAEAEA
ncbi:MAG: hypothetical protein H8E14_08590 [Candidatus Marinimicrobia bacterium]|nr:hypothetical protein [Candidatus Neomarinimicrobiota bacterium]